MPGRPAQWRTRPPRGLGPQGRDAADHGEIDGEGLAPVEPVLALEHGEGEDDEPVAEYGAGEDRGVGRGERHDLEPGEGEIARAGRPGGEAREADVAGAAEAAAKEARRRSPRRDRPPQVAEGEAGEAEADPEERPDREGQRVGEGVAAAGEAGGDEGEEPEAGERARQGVGKEAAAVEEKPRPGRRGAPGREADDGGQRHDGAGGGDRGGGREGEDHHRPPAWPSAGQGTAKRVRAASTARGSMASTAP